MSEQPDVYRPRCLHLYCKAMAVHGEDFEQDPEYQAGVMEFWCLCTSRGQGPDGDGVSLEECCNPERSCYRAY